jgi:putative transposase
LWRSVDQDGEVVDVFLRARRDGTAAKYFFKLLLKSHHSEPRKIDTGSMQQVQRFLSVHAAVHNLFNPGRNLISAQHYRLFRQRAFASWEYATAV